MRKYVDTLKVLFLVCSLDAAIPEPASAQSESGGSALNGVVRDESGDVVPGVAISARHVDTGAVRTTLTDGGGRFSLLAMPVGPYTLDAALSGFVTTRQEGVVLSVGRTTSLALVLRAGGVAESVTVTSPSATLDQEGTAVGTALDQRAITDLPIRGRN